METTKMVTYKINKTKKPLIPESVKVRVAGIVLIALGVLSAIVSKNNGCYDATVASFLVPIGLAVLFGKYD